MLLTRINSRVALNYIFVFDGFVEGDNVREVYLLEFTDFEVGVVTVFTIGLMPMIGVFIP